jgi:hypothetical protein
MLIPDADPERQRHRRFRRLLAPKQISNESLAYAAAVGSGPPTSTTCNTWGQIFSPKTICNTPDISG